MLDVPQPRKRGSVSLSSLSEGQGTAHTEIQSDIGESILDEAFAEDDVMLSPEPKRKSSPSSGRSIPVGKKRAKQMNLEDQVDRAMMHSQRELAKATSAQVDIMQQQLVVSQK
ncbi:unnamed protein product [Phytophthora fragariaefolia]|uniref:Unnamed protein product n=1 Tax=Phytophthora fragariaefolia TaxID=1490495 RepID=A0A9W6U453_9STRA|nr:unnamed protein product [Phytophthora fragariaefolia]